MKRQETAESFSRFFDNKIEKIGQGFVGGPSEKRVPPAHMFSCCHELSGHQILKLNYALKPTTAAVGPVSTKLALEFTHLLLPVFHKIVNPSLEPGIVAGAFKKAIVKPLIKSQTWTLRSSATTARCRTCRTCPRSLTEQLLMNCRHI